MFASRAMMSIGMILIGLQFFLKEDLAQTTRIYYRDKILFVLSLVFFIYLTSGLYSEKTDVFLEKIAIKLPLLFMPLGFAALKEMPKKYFQNLLYCFLLLALFTAGTSICMLINDYDAIIESYKYAKVLPNIFGISHIRLSLMMVIAIFASFYLFRENYFFFHKSERYLLAFTGVFIFIFIHILSVRSGLLAFYACCFILTLSNTFLYKKYLIGIAILAIITLMPIVAYYTLPTVHNKVNYMATDVSRFIKGEGVNHWSDGNRLLSIKIGIEVGNTNSLIGVGVGDVQKEMFAYYKKYHRYVLKEFRLIPHNQFVYVYTGCGLIGLAVFLFASFYPFSKSITYHSTFFLSVLVTIISSYLSEATLENQLGVCLFITFYLIGWSCKPELKPENS
jgi:O-antigen ligase